MEWTVTSGWGETPSSRQIPPHRALLRRFARFKTGPRGNDKPGKIEARTKQKNCPPAYLHSLAFRLSWAETTEPKENP